MKDVGTGSGSGTAQFASLFEFMDSRAQAPEM
jgi:hypothetical protein